MVNSFRPTTASAEFIFKGYGIGHAIPTDVTSVSRDGESGALLMLMQFRYNLYADKEGLVEGVIRR